MSGSQISLFKDLQAAELQSYINKIKEINNVDYGDFNTSQIQNYANALSDLAPTQTALLLSTQGLSNAKIQETLAAQGLTDTQQYEAFSNAGLLKSKVSLTAAESQYAIQKAFITEMSQADAAAKASETMASLGLSAALQGEGTETVKLTAKKLAHLVEQKKLTDAQAKEIAIRVGLTNSIKSQATGAIPAWIANIKAMTIATWDQIKATAVWLATTPAGWATAAVGAIAAVIGGMTIYKKHLENIRQATAESANAYKEASSSIDGYVSKYQELHQALLDAKGNEEEIYNIKKQLLDLQTELNDKFGEEYGKLNLVTDAYKNHSEAIKAYSKDAAQSFLNNTGEKGIKDAKKQMLDDKNYVLGMGVSLYSEEGLAIQELADKYGIHMNPDESSGTFSLMLKADAATAESTINDFMSDVRNLRDSGDFDFTDPFDHVLEYSNGELQRVQDTIEQFGNTLQQILIAEITKDDDDLSRKYEKAIESVEAYNDAILKSEDPFHDESVKKYRQDLEAAKAAFSTEELEDYGYVIHDVFDQADTNLLDFYDKLQNDSGLQKFAEQLKGFDRISLESMADAKNNNAFNRLITAADEYELEVNDLIDLLIKLAIAQDDISSDTPGFEDSSWDYTTTLQNLDKVKEKLEVLEQSYTKLFDANNSISFEDLSSISEAFSDVDGIEDYIKRIQDAGENTEEVGQIFGELTGAYLDHSGILSHVTDENKNLIISMLDEMGIANAEEIVLAQLNAQHEILALQKQFVAEKGHELANATLEEITQFLTEANVSDITRQALAQLALEKINFSNINFNEAGNIAQLISLANAAGASAQAVATAKAALNTLSDINKNGANGTAADFHRLDNASLTLQQIKDKTYDWNYQKLDPNDFIVTNSPQYTPRYSIPNTGLSNTGSAIDNSREEAEQAQDAFEKSINFFEQRVKVLEDAFDNLEKGMKNVFGTDAKNTLLTAQIGVLDEEVNNYTDALSMYRQKADEALSGMDSDLRDKIVNGAVQLTDFMGKGNEEVVEAIEAYQDWAGKVADCTQKLEELKTQIRQLELQKFNNIMEDFNNQFDLRSDSIDLIKKQIALLEEAGELIGESFYSKQIEQAEKQLHTLESEKARLVQQLNEALSSGRIQKGTEEWLEMVNALSDVEGSILDCKTSIEEFDNALLELNVRIFERIQTEFGNLNSEMENLAGLFDEFNDIRVSDGKGAWTDQAIATLGLYAQQYELARYQVAQYGDAIDRLNKDYLAGRYSATEYADKLADLSKEQWDAVNSANSLEDAIIDLNETRVNEEIEVIEEEIDAYKELTDAQIKALEAAKDLHDYEESIAEKTKNITDIERQLAAMQNDDSSATVAKRKKLEEQLAQARKDLEETEYAHSIDAQKEAINKQYEDYEAQKNADIEALKLTLEDRELLISNSFGVVKANAGTVGEQLAMIAQEHGIVISNAILSPWQSGENAIASYGAVLTEQTSAFIGNILGIQTYLYGLQMQANTTADSLSYMFSARADNLVNQLVSSYYSEANLNAMTNSLQNSLINTLERGYNINGITTALSSIASGADSVAAAANRAASALASTGAVSVGSTEKIKFPKEKGTIPKAYVIGSNNYGNHTVFASSSSEAIKQLQAKYPKGFGWHVVNTLQAYAKGGIITNKDHGLFDPVAKAIGEDAMVAVKHGEGILTPDQTSALLNLTPMLDDLNKTWNLSGLNGNHVEPVKKDNTNVTLHYDSLIEINGDVNDTNHFTKQVGAIAQTCINKTFEEMSRDLRYGK